MKKNLFIGIALLGLLSSCAHVNSLSITSIPADRKNPVKIKKEKIIILGFNFDNDFVDELVDDLKSQCPKGKVTGLLTKDENIDYFLYFVWKKQVTATGYCVPTSTVSLNKNTIRKTSSDDSESPEESEGL